MAKPQLSNLAPLRRLFRLRVLRRGKAAQWAGEIDAVVCDLTQMNRATEADFLAITDKLTALLAAARTISAETRAITDSLSGTAGESVCGALRSVLDRARNTGQQADARTALVQVRNSIAPVRRSLADFERVNPLLHVMATLARIETAHLGSAGGDLGHLAGEFRSAGEDIGARVESILQGAGMVERRIESALQEASALDKGSLRVLPSLLEFAERGLKDFRARQEQGARTTSELASQSDALVKAIGDIVASIQFHDITRQQVEHAIDSLRRLRDQPGAAALGLQIAQLEHARTAFVDAVRQVDQRLESITGRIREMEGASGSLLGPSDHREASFYAQMQDCFRTIAEIEATCTILDQRAQSAVTDLQETLTSFEESAQGIHRVELRLRWLAINAAINAAHIGARGEPLEAVAGAMHRLLTECEAHSAAADREIRTMAGTIGNATGGSAGLEGELGDNLSDQLQCKIAELHQLDDRAAQGSRQIAAIVSGLSADLAALRRSISAEQIFRQTTERCCRVLGGIRAQVGRQSGPADAGELGKFGAHYTMRAEREIHENIAGSASPASAAGAESEADPAEFGENVELF